MVLTEAERVQLTLLIAHITEHMRKAVTDNFDSSITSGKPPEQALHMTDKNPNIDESKPHEPTDEEKKSQELRNRREKELSAPKMLELKKAYLEFFDKWSESVIARVGTVVNNPKEVTQEQKDKASTVDSPAAAASQAPQVVSE